MNTRSPSQGHATFMPDAGWTVSRSLPTYLSGDFDRYWQFHIDQDQRRLYPVAWAVVPK